MPTVTLDFSTITGAKCFCTVNFVPTSTPYIRAGSVIATTLASVPLAPDGTGSIPLLPGVYTVTLSGPMIPASNKDAFSITVPDDAGPHTFWSLINGGVYNPPSPVSTMLVPDTGIGPLAGSMWIVTVKDGIFGITPA